MLLGRAARLTWPLVFFGIVLLLMATIVAVLVVPPLVVAGDPSEFSGPAKDFEAARNAVRGTILQGAAGALLTLGAIATWRTLEVNRRQRLDDEFVRAIELLTKMAGPQERLLPLSAAHIGAVHTLERVMHTDRTKQPAVVAVLSAYVRQFSPRSQDLNDLSRTPVFARQLGSRRPSVWWALDTLMRRSPTRGDPVIDLSAADMRYTTIDLDTLSPVHLEGADLRGCEIFGTGHGKVMADHLTLWPYGFNRTAAGVTLVDRPDSEDLADDFH